MEIITKDEKRFITVGPIQLLLRPTVLGLVDDVKKLTQAEHEAIIRDAGVDVPANLDPEFETRVVSSGMMFETHPRMSLAMSILQNEWYREQQAAVPEVVYRGHEDRLRRFNELVELAKTRSPRPVAEPKVSKLPSDLPPRQPLNFQPVANMPSVILSDDQHVNIFVEDLNKTIDELRKRPDAKLYESIIGTQGLTVRPDVPANKSYLLAEAVVTLWWQELASGGQGSEAVRMVVKRAYARYNKLDKLNKSPKQPKAVTFGVGPNADALKGQYQEVYRAAMVVSTANGDGYIAQEALVAEALAKGFTTREKNVAYRIRWLALQLVKTGHLFIVGQQSEIPGTPGKLPG